VSIIGLADGEHEILNRRLPARRISGVPMHVPNVAENRVQIILVAGVVLLAASSCGAFERPSDQGVQSTATSPASSSPRAIYPDETYDSFGRLAEAYSLSGGRCTNWSSELDPGADVRQWTCVSEPDRAANLFLESSPETTDQLALEIQAQLKANRREGVVKSFLLGDGWAIAGDPDEIEIIQDEMGGFLRTP